MTQTLQLASVSDFASYWTSAEFEKGVQTDIVQQVADVSLPSSKLQIARLRAAWKLAQGSALAPVATKGATAKTGGVVGMGWSSPEVKTSSWDGLWRPSFSRRATRRSSRWMCLMSPWPTAPDSWH